MKILGINISHNASICQITDGHVDFYLEEDRFNKIKNYNPFLNIKEWESIKQYVNNDIDYVIFSSFDRREVILEPEGNPDQDFFNRLKELSFRPMSLEKVISLQRNSKVQSNLKFITFRDYVVIDEIKKQIPGNPKFIFHWEHHLYHAYSGFHLSNFDEALCLVMDGGGAQTLENYPDYQEVESIYYLNKFENICFYKHLSNCRTWGHPEIGYPHQEEFFLKINNVDIVLSSNLSSGQKFSNLTRELGLGEGQEAGKTMGLSSYGNLEGNRPEDLAKQLQVETRDHTINLIKKALQYKDTKNIILSGGYALNCVNNYEYVKYFPDCNFFVDPIAHDGGTSLGAAYWLDWKIKNDN